MRFIGYWFVYFVLSLCAVVGFVEVGNTIFTILESGVKGIGGADGYKAIFYAGLSFVLFIGTGMYATNKQ